MATQQENFARLQAALTQLSAPPTTNAILYPGPERYSIIIFILERLLSPDLVNTLQKRISDADLPGGLSPEEAQAHRLARVLQYVDFYVPVDQVRGCTSLEDSIRLLTALANLASAHQQYTREATTTATAAAAAAGAGAAGPSSNGRAPSPGPASGPFQQQQQQASSSTPRHRTPVRGGRSSGGGADGGGGGAGGRPLLGLQSLEGELRLLDGLAERLPQLMEPGGGGNWVPGDILATLQSTYLSTNPSLQEFAAAVEQRSAKLRGELPGLKSAEARLAAEVTVAGEPEWQQHVEATRAELASLLETSAAFYHTFQTGLGVWCAASSAADTCNLGPMASELLQRYDTLRRLGAELGRIRQAHNGIVSCAPPLTLLDQHTLSQLVRAGQQAVEQMQERIAVEQRVRAEAEATAAAARACVAAMAAADAR